MSETILFVAHGFRRENILLQPWRYIYEIAVRMVAGRRVIVITDSPEGTKEETWPERIQVVSTDLLSFKKRNSLVALINSYEATQVWWSTTPRTIAYSRAWKRITCPLTAMITCPLYPWKVLLRAWAHGVPLEELKALLLQRMVPRGLFVRLLSQSKVKNVIVQSRANREVLVAAGVPAEKVRVVPVGLDHRDRAVVPAEKINAIRKMLDFPENATVLLYLGAVRPIRGIDALLEAFPLVIRESTHTYLGVLARGASEEQCDKLRARCRKLGIEDKVSIVGGWLSREQVWASIEACDLVVLPFVVVPSDVPIAVLEALARGKPVISSTVDGLPELVQGRGAVVDPLNRQQMAAAMLELAGSESTRRQMAQAAREFMETYPDWDKVAALSFSTG